MRGCVRTLSILVLLGLGMLPWPNPRRASDEAEAEVTLALVGGWHIAG